MMQRMMGPRTRRRQAAGEEGDGEGEGEGEVEGEVEGEEAGEQESRREIKEGEEEDLEMLMMSGKSQHWQERGNPVHAAAKGLRRQGVGEAERQSRLEKDGNDDEDMTAAAVCVVRAHATASLDMWSDSKDRELQELMERLLAYVDLSELVEMSAHDIISVFDLPDKTRVLQYLSPQVFHKPLRALLANRAESRAERAEVFGGGGRHSVPTTQTSKLPLQYWLREYHIVIGMWRLLLHLSFFLLMALILWFNIPGTSGSVRWDTNDALTTVQISPGTGDAAHDLDTFDDVHDVSDGVSYLTGLVNYWVADTRQKYPDANEVLHVRADHVVNKLELAASFRDGVTPEFMERICVFPGAYFNSAVDHEEDTCSKVVVPSHKPDMLNLSWTLHDTSLFENFTREHIEDPELEWVSATWDLALESAPKQRWQTKMWVYNTRAHLYDADLTRLFTWTDADSMSTTTREDARDVLTWLSVLVFAFTLLRDECLTFASCLHKEGQWRRYFSSPTNALGSIAILLYTGLFCEFLHLRYGNYGNKAFGYWAYVSCALVAVLGLRLFAFTAFHPGMGVFTRVIMRTGVGIANFLTFYAGLLLTFAVVLGFMGSLSGNQNELRSVASATQVVGLMTFGFLDQEGFTNGFLGYGGATSVVTVVFWVCVFLSAIFAQNLFLAIIVDAFSDETANDEDFNERIFVKDLLRVCVAWAVFHGERPLEYLLHGSPASSGQEQADSKVPIAGSTTDTPFCQQISKTTFVFVHWEFLRLAHNFFFDRNKGTLCDYSPWVSSSDGPIYCPMSEDCVLHEQFHRILQQMRTCDTFQRAMRRSNVLRLVFGHHNLAELAQGPPAEFIEATQPL